ncbi:SH3 domain-containing protein [Candidatus Pantoea multigeneris]|uniref:SH3 domain-containing protein n=1 Tax=Candidatus Pantoea multigeneris TaxID=2608357 RepID=A0ABX0R7U5_9GAMM|nr:SH3 domain-containing protein [Pantoea multigeneris]NIF20223.1 SH3 domain-containing protein [Pantoea multigeneris]
MKNVFFTLLISLWLTSKVFAGETMTGVLQAYWLPDWTENNVNHPELLLRLLKVDEKGNLESIVYLKNSNLTESFVREHFHSIPVEFYKYHEGYVNQYGKLKFTHLIQSGECGGRIANANYVGFMPSADNVEIIPSAEQCDLHPYKLIYRLKDEIKNLSLKQEPNASSKIIGNFTPEDTITKIKTINDQWLYVSDYDESQKDDIGKIRGFIEADKVVPLN